MITRRTYFWILFNIVLGLQLVGLIFETLAESHSWWWTVAAFLLVVLINVSILSDVKKEEKI